MTAKIATPASIDKLLSRVAPESQELPPLLPQKPYDASLSRDIDSFVDSAAGGKTCARVALHLLNDDIDRAHKLAQSDEGEETSDLCHGILHRREGEFWNSRIWFDLIRHPLVSEIYGNSSKAKTFIDDIEKITKTKSSASTPCSASNLDRLKRLQADELSQIVQYILQHHVSS